MEDDDRTVAGIFFYVIENSFSIQFLTVIPCNDVPHDDFVFLSQFMGLSETHVSVRGTEECTMYKLIGGIDITYVIFYAVFRATFSPTQKKVAFTL